MKNRYLIPLLCMMACTVKNPVKPLVEKTVEALPSPAAPKSALNRYAGIEIGSTGVKFTIIDLNRTIDQADGLTYFVYDRIEEDAANTKFIDFTADASGETALAVSKFYRKAKDTYQLSELQIFICVSHGAVTQAMKKDKVTNSDNCATLTDLKKRILQRIPTYAKARNGCIGFLGEHEESELTHIGIIPRELQTDVALVDIGSGNTKGGYFVAEPQRKFIPFDISEGTRSLSNKAKLNLAADQFDQYRSKVEAIIKDEWASKIRSSVADLRIKQDIILTGGICWAVARVINVNDKKDMQQITVEEVSKVVNLVSDNQSFKELQEKAKLPENKELKLVLNVFNQDLLIAGSILLKKMLEGIKRDSTDHHFYVYKTSYVGWLKGYIISSISGDHTGYKSICREINK